MLTLQSTKTRITDAEAVTRVLNHYDFDFEADVGVDEQGVPYLLIESEEREPCALPVEWLLTEYGVLGWDERWELQIESGEEGFTALLLELAPYLATELRLVCTSRDINGKVEGMTEWSIAPGAKDVRNIELDCDDCDDCDD